jgi:hypothetical protein
MKHDGETAAKELHYTGMKEIYSDKFEDFPLFITFASKEEISPR